MVLNMYATSSTVVFTFTQQNRDEGRCTQNGVKWKDLMSTLILDRLEASFANCRDDELPRTMTTTQNMTNNCDGCQQCNSSGGESSSTRYFDTASNDDTCHQHSTTDHDSMV